MAGLLDFYSDPRQQGVLGTVAGLLQAGGPSTFPVSSGQAISSGILGGMGAYNQAQLTQSTNLTRQAQAMEAMQKMEQARRQAAARANITPSAPPQIQQPPMQGLSYGSANAVGAPWAQQQPPQSGFEDGLRRFAPMFAPETLATAAQEGVDIDPFLKLNEATAPKISRVNRGNEILEVDDRTGQIIRRYPMGSAPGSIPSHLADLDPSGQRAFLISQGVAGRPSVNVNTKMGEGLAKEVGPIATEGRAAAMAAVNVVETVGRVSKALESGNVTLGPGATIRNKADQIGQLLGVGGTSTEERLVNTRNAIRGLAQMTVSARKALKGQGTVSDYEGRLLQEAESGQIDNFTVPELRDFLKVTERIARQSHAEHKRMIGVMGASKDEAVRGLVPYFDVPALPSGERITLRPETIEFLRRNNIKMP